MSSAVPMRRVPGVRRRRRRSGGVARIHPVPAVRVPARRRARLLARTLARSEVSIQTKTVRLRQHK